MTTKIRLSLVSLLLVLQLVCGVSASLAQIAVVDTAGRTVVISEPAGRIVALTPADCEILYALGAGELLAGRGEYCNSPEEILALPVIQSGENVNLEEILALSPQVVLMGTGFDTLAQASMLESLGVTAVVTGADSIDETYEIIRLLGALSGRDEAAEAMIADMRESLAAIAERRADSEKTVYFEISPLQYGLYTAGADTFMDELAALCGARNAFADVSGWAAVSEEQVLLRDPDYIVTTTMYYGVGPAPDEEIMSRPGWENLRAVKQGHVLAVDADMFSRPGPRLKDAALALEAFLYETE